MALSLDYGTNVIFVPKADLTLVAGNLYELDVDAFRKELKSIEASQGGIPGEDTHIHNTQVVLSGVVYARTVEIIAPWTVEFEDPGGAPGQYVVRCTGANHNLADVKVANQVSLIIGNSAGLIVTDTSGLTAGESAALLALASDVGTMTKIIRNRKITDPDDGTLYIFNDPLAVTGLTQTGGTATATCVGHGLQSGETVYMDGMVEDDYRGMVIVTVVDPDTFTYTVSAAAASPATGSPTVEPPFLTAKLYEAKDESQDYRARGAQHQEPLA